MTPHEKKKRTVCFLQILGTISNAIDVFSLFALQFWNLETELQTKVNLFRDPCL